MRVLRIFAFVVALFLLCVPAHAASPANTVLQEGLQKVLDLIRSPAYSDPATRDGQRTKIGTVVREYFDFREFSSRTVGARWKQFSADEQSRFSAAFADLLIYTYVNKIDGYNGEQIQYVGERSAKDRVEIMTNVTMKDGKKIPVAYRMLPKDGTWKVYDVLLESISLVKNYRTQFQDILKTASPAELIDRIRAKAEEARARHGR